MPRTARAIEAGTVYHVLNRGNGRMRIFHKEGDYEAFLRVLTEGLQHYAIELFTYCLMPNHWHLVVRPGSDEALGRWMGWVGVTHVRRYHEHYHSRGGGHLYQGRFKSFPVAETENGTSLICKFLAPEYQVGTSSTKKGFRLPVIYSQVDLLRQAGGRDIDLDFHR